MSKYNPINDGRPAAAIDTGPRAHKHPHTRAFDAAVIAHMDADDLSGLHNDMVIEIEFRRSHKREFICP